MNNSRNGWLDWQRDGNGQLDDNNGWLVNGWQWVAMDGLEGNRNGCLDNGWTSLQ